MYLAIINQETNVVENIIVPPEGAQAYFVAEGYYGVITDTGSIGDTYEKETGIFTKPDRENSSET